MRIRKNIVNKEKNMQKINDKCCICGEDIDEYAYYITDDKRYYCCEECVENAIDEENFKEISGISDIVEHMIIVSN